MRTAGFTCGKGLQKRWRCHKKFKTWGDFEKAVAEHQDDSKPDFEAIAESERRRLDNEDIGNKEFISHTARLAGN